MRSPRAGGVKGDSRKGRASSSFLKKRTKKLLLIGRALCGNARANG
jgi:hypothetical protein